MTSTFSSKAGVMPPELDWRSALERWRATPLRLPLGLSLAGVLLLAIGGDAALRASGLGLLALVGLAGAISRDDALRLLLPFVAGLVYAAVALTWGATGDRDLVIDGILPSLIVLVALAAVADTGLSAPDSEPPTETWFEDLFVEPPADLVLLAAGVERGALAPELQDRIGLQLPQIATSGRLAPDALGIALPHTTLAEAEVLTAVLARIDRRLRFGLVRYPADAPTPEALRREALSALSLAQIWEIESAGPELLAPPSDV